MIRAIPIFRAGARLSLTDPGPAGAHVATVLVCHRKWEDRPQIGDDGRITIVRRGQAIEMSASALLLMARARFYHLRLAFDGSQKGSVLPRRTRPRTHQAALDRLACPETGATLRPNRWARRTPRRARRRRDAKQAELFPERQIEFFGGDP